MAAITTTENPPVPDSTPQRTPTKPHPRLAWIRYGQPISSWQLKKAAGKYQVAILNPWEHKAAHYLKEHDPHMTVLAYKTLTSVPTDEPGPIYSSGVHPTMALNLGTSAHLTRRVEHKGHDHQRVWELSYQQAWTAGVAAELHRSPFDGVMVDSDLDEKFFRHELDKEQTLQGIEKIFNRAGEKLARVGKILVPNFTSPDGSWHKHSRFGGGFETNWLGWGSAGDDWFSVDDCLAQVQHLGSIEDGLIVARVPGANRNYGRHLGFALAAAWIFLPQHNIAVTATGADDYNGVPLTDDIDLGDPTSDVIRDGDVFSREFTGGKAIVNLGDIMSPGGLRPHSGKLLPN